MLVEPFKFNLDPEAQAKDRASFEAQANAMMQGPLNKAFEESFNLMISSLMSIPLDKPEMILAMVAQIKGLIHVHENLRDMIASHKFRVEEAKRDNLPEDESKKDE